jgi:predicted ATPase
MPDTPINIFISYAHADSAFVDRIDADLRQQGFATWVDRQRLAGGQRWRRELQEAVERTQVLLIVLSPDAVASDNVQIEYDYALAEHKVVIPLYYRQCNVPMELRAIQWIDFRHRYEQGFEALLDALHRQQGRAGASSSAQDNEPRPHEGRPPEPGARDASASRSLMGQQDEFAAKPAPMWKVPTTFTSLIGREQEVAQISDLLTQPEVRLLTLLGPGGIGKTRLSIAVATQMRTFFAAGICFIALAATSDPDLVVPTIAQELGLKESGTQSLLEQVQAALGEEHFLLLLDNFEQMVAAASEVEQLLASCPNLKIVVTSREVLHVGAEHEFPVPPLALPDLTHLPALEALSHNAAVALFIQRCQAVKPNFQLTSVNAPTVAEICTRLDGLPLAIELAAARVRLLSPQALLTRLSARLQLLTSGPRDVPARQQTLRNTIAWSYQLLDAQEQRLYRQLCVFVGGCTLEAVEALCAALGEGDGSVLEGVTSLIDKSLLRQTEQTEEEPRLMMLETIREYGLEVLEVSGEQEATQLAYASYYLRLAEEAAKGIRGPQQTAWLQRLEREHDNLRAALQWSLEQGEAGLSMEMALRFSKALDRFWEIRGHYSEGRTFLKRALAASKGSLTSMRASALNIAAGLAELQGDYGEAEELSEESLALSRSLKDRRNIATSLFVLAGVAVAKDNFLKADSLMKEALALYEELGDEVDIAEALFELGWLANVQNEYQRARPLLEESLSKFREMGDTRMIAHALYQLTHCYDEQLDAATVHSLLQESDRLFREVGDKEGMAYVLQLSGKLAFRQGDTAMARSYMEESSALYREIGDRWVMYDPLDDLARMARDQGDYQAAQAFFVENLAIIIEDDAKGWNNKESIASRLEELARLVVAQGELAWAAQLWGAAEVLREATEVPLPPKKWARYEQAVAAARTQLGEEDFARAWAVGRTMSPEQVLAAKR